MSPDHALLVAPIEALLAGEPVIECRRIESRDLPGLAQLYVDAHDVTIEAAGLEIIALLNGEQGEPLEAGWLGVFAGWGAPMSAVLCARRGELPVIIELLTDPAYRNRGFASSLVREVAQLFRPSGATELGMRAALGGESSGLLEELGFAEPVALGR